jgi:hypothetical protein
VTYRPVEFKCDRCKVSRDLDGSRLGATKPLCAGCQVPMRRTFNFGGLGGRFGKRARSARPVSSAPIPDGPEPDLVGGDNMLIRNCDISDNHQYGIDLEGIPFAAQRTSFRNNKLGEIRVRGVDGFTVDDCRFQADPEV